MAFLVAASAAQAGEGAGQRGVLFYAGFDGTRDAVARGSGQASLVGDGGQLTADGFDSIRGGALRSGDGVGHVEFDATNNIVADEGTIEIWVKPGNWSSGDNRQHVFLEVAGKAGGSIRYFKRAGTVDTFWVKGPDAPAPAHYDEKGQGLAQFGYAAQQAQDTWVQYFLIWKRGELLAWYRGYVTPHMTEGGPQYVHRTLHLTPNTPSPGALDVIRIGDFAGGAGRNAFSYIDEVYIYDRALTYEECVWANRHARDREPGRDIPLDFAEPTLSALPDPANRVLVAEIDSGDRAGRFSGEVRLDPPTGTAPAPIVATGGRYGEARIPYDTLPEGSYRLIADLRIGEAQAAKIVSTELIVPGPPVWLTEKAGVSEFPPPPWTPVELDEDGRRLRVWGRQYRLGEFGLPNAIETAGQELLSGPVTWTCTTNAEPVFWEPVRRETVTRTAAAVTMEGAARSALGELTWRVQAEYDGFLLYDLTLKPEPGATCDGLQLRVPLRGEAARLWYQGARMRSFVPPGTGTLHQATSSRYWWIGTDDFGLCGAMEHAGAHLDRVDDGFSIVREPNGAVVVVYRFLSGAMPLAEDWKLRWVLQATPTKPLPPGWRDWRDVTRSTPAPAGASPRARLVVANPWPAPARFKAFSFPVVKDPDWFRGYIREQHAQGHLVLPYSQLATLSPELPECAFYKREWHNPAGGLQATGTALQYVSARYVPSYIDFMAWKHRELAREYGHDGLYVDFAGVRGGFLALEHGAGYVRDGKAYPADFPIVSLREMWKRVYTVFKELNPDSVIVGHTSDGEHVPVLAFCDVWLNGEHNWLGQLKDNYLDVLPLDQLRAAFRVQGQGGIPWWLPQWYHAVLEDRDVATRFDADYVTVGLRGNPRTTSVEKSHHMFGIGLLLDVGFWPIAGTNQDAMREYYTLRDTFGIADAVFTGYWDSRDLVGGQTDAVKVSLYRKPGGDTLLVAYNTARQAETVTLHVDWAALTGGDSPAVVDAYTGEPVAVSGREVTLDVPPLNGRVLLVTAGVGQP